MTNPKFLRPDKRLLETFSTVNDYVLSLEAEIERLRAALRAVMDCTGTSTRQYHIARDALGGADEPTVSTSHANRGS